MGGSCIATFSYAGGSTLTNFAWSHSSASMSKSSLFFLVLSVLLMSLVLQNLLPITCLLLGGVSVLLPVKFSSEDYAVTPLFIGGVLCTNLNRNRVGCCNTPALILR